MSQLGYEVESAPCGFGLKQVPASAIEIFSERGHQIKTVKSLLQRGYTATQITGALKGLSDDEKRSLLTQHDALRMKLGRAEGKPRLVADHLIDQQAVTLTRPKKFPITSKSLKEDVIARLGKAGVVVQQPSGFPVNPR